MRDPVDEYERERWDKIANEYSKEALVALINWGVTDTIFSVDLDNNTVSASMGYNFNWKLNDSIEFWEIKEIGRGDNIAYSETSTWVKLRYRGQNE